MSFTNLFRNASTRRARRPPAHQRSYFFRYSYFFNTTLARMHFPRKSKNAPSEGDSYSTEDGNIVALPSAY